MMKLQDVILKAMAKKISWLDATEIIGVCDRTRGSSHIQTKNSVNVLWTMAGVSIFLNQALTQL
jgi:hypothetical protein